MHDLAVLFLHHTDDAATRNNLACVRHFNPSVPIIPLSNWGVTLPGGFHPRNMTRGWRKLLPAFRGKGLAGAWGRYRLNLAPRWVWRNADLAAYLWMTWPRRPVQARRWVILEWDVYCNTSLVDWYAPNWDEAVTSTCTQVPGRNDEFYFFNEKERLAIPAAYRPSLMATNPWAGMMFSDEALTAIAARVRESAWCNGFCELRVATAAKSLGYEPTIHRNPLAARTLRSPTMFDLAEIDVPSVWHRVKRHDVLTLAPECTLAAPAAHLP
ncbi:MAG: hypothetical protein JWM57_1685 [Phycisphaerales bacterium]|nr:hypothetical protein [Phycisphaerales bacterium]